MLLRLVTRISPYQVDSACMSTVRAVLCGVRNNTMTMVVQHDVIAFGQFAYTRTALINSFKQGLWCDSNACYYIAFFEKNNSVRS